MPGDVVGKFKPEGFTIDEIGPASTVGKGKVDCERDMESLRSIFGSGCPMAMGVPSHKK